MFLAEILLLLIFSTAERISHVMAQEGVTIEDSLGVDTLRKVDGISSEVFNTIFIDNGVYAGIWHTFIPTEQEKEDSEGLENLGAGLFKFLDDKLTVIGFLLFQTIHRITLFCLWLPSFLILIALSFYTGLIFRKIKQGNFSFASPTMHRMCIKLILIIFTILPLLLMFPLPLSPYLYSYLYIAIAFMIMVIVANIAKRV